MQRRDVLRLLTTTAMASAMPLEILQSLQQARAEVGPSRGLRTLNPHQNATVILLSERIIPETDTAGAKSTKVNEFIDLLLTEWYDKPDTDRFLQGRHFGKDFVDCSTAQQTELMKEWDSAALDYAKANKASLNAKFAAPPANFFYTVKRLTIVGYYTSEVGFTKELKATIIPLKHAGCAPLSEARS